MCVSEEDARAVERTNGCGERLRKKGRRQEYDGETNGHYTRGVAKSSGRFYKARITRSGAPRELSVCSRRRFFVYLLELIKLVRCGLLSFGILKIYLLRLVAVIQNIRFTVI